jgi:hypothetical protein
MSGKVGDIALQGKREYIRGHIFDAVDYERTILCRGSLITVFDPKAPKDSEPRWKYTDTAKDAEHSVPPGFEVEVLDGWVRLTK